MNDATPLVSVLIPAFNAAPYLAACLDSVLRQDYSNWEAIIADDGSTDDTPRIAGEYASRDARFRTLSQTNRGLAATRNRLMELARGEWFVFLDADDILPRNNISLLIHLALAHGCDAAGGRMRSFHTLPDTTTDGKTSIPTLLSPQQAAAALLFQTDGPDTSASAKIFRASLWQGIRFREGILYEDLDVIYRAILRSNSYLHVPATLYHYRTTPGSIIHTFSERRLDVLDVTARIENYMSENLPELLPAARDRSMSAAFNIMLIYAAAGKRDAGVERRCLRIIADRRFDSLKNRKVRAKNRIAALLSYTVPLKLIPRILSLIYRKKT